MVMPPDGLRPPVEATIDLSISDEQATLAEMGKLGVFGVELPQEAGGLGQDALTSGLVLEALSGADYNLGYIPVTVSLIGQILHSYGRPEVVRPYPQGMTAGELIPNIALTEPAAGSDAANLGLKARKVGSDYVLTGEKNSISMATQADLAVVLTRAGTPFWFRSTSRPSPAAPFSTTAGAAPGAAPSTSTTPWSRPITRSAMRTKHSCR